MTVAPGRVPQGTPASVVLLVEFVPSPANPRVARPFSCDLTAPRADPPTTTEVRAVNMQELDLLLVRVLRDLDVPDDVEEPVAAVKRAPYPGENVFRHVEQKIRAVKCPECETVVVPPRSICGSCNARMEEWTEVGPGGTVENYTIGRVRLDKGQVKDADPPILLGLIKLDGADTLFAAEIRDLEPEKLQEGLRVTAVWEDEPQGVLQDLAYFKPEGS